MLEQVTIKLKEPIEADGTQHTELTMREPTLGMLAEADKEAGVHNVNRRLISLAAGVPDAVIRQLPMSTYNEALRFFSRFAAAPTAGGG